MTDQQRANAGDAIGGATFVAVLGVVAGIFVIWKLAAAGVLRAFPALPADLLDRSGIGAVLAFLLLLKCRPEGRSGWMRSLCGVLVMNAGLFLINAVAAQLAATISPEGPYDYAVGYVEWGQICVIFLAYFPLASGLARIGLLPGLRWNGDAARAGDRTERQEGTETPPGWWAPRIAQFLPALVLVSGLFTVGPSALERLAAAWPESFIAAMDPRQLMVTASVAATLAFVACIRQPWYASLAAVGFAAACMGLVTVGFALSTPVWIWLGLGARTSQAIAQFAPLVLTVAVAIYLVYRLPGRESRREDAEVSADPNAAPGEESRA